MYDGISLLLRKQMPRRKTVLDLLCLGQCQDVEVVRLCPMNLMSLLLTGVEGACKVHHDPSDVLVFLDGAVAIPSTASIIFARAEVIDCVCGQNSRQATAQVERYSPSICHATGKLAALRFATAKTTAKMK